VAEEVERKRGYPYMSVNVWAEIRRAFAKNLPSRVTTTYLQTILKSSAKAAGNLLPQLKTLGIIDNDGAPLELAKRFRMDSEYPEVVTEILDRVYPSELRGLFPGPTEEAGDITNWFMLHTGGGQVGSAAQSRFYLMLISGELPTAEARKVRLSSSSSSSSSSSDSSAKPKSEITTLKKPKTADAAKPSAANPADVSNAAPVVPLPSGGQAALPGLHLDIQIHIDADASVDQIDAVFASMARHIYKSG
jgi:hypothetical protein